MLFEKQRVLNFMMAMGMSSIRPRMNVNFSIRCCRSAFTIFVVRSSSTLMSEVEPPRFIASMSFAKELVRCRCFMPIPVLLPSSNFSSFPLFAAEILTP